MTRDNAWQDKKVTYEPELIDCTFETLTVHFDRQMHYRVAHKGFVIEFFAFLHTGATNLLISGQDAIQRQRDQLPYFYRWSWHRDITASFITFNDPTLYMGDSLDAGWCQGYREVWAVEAIDNVLQRLAQLVAIGPEETVLYGISAGGFWALMAAVCFPRCQVIVEIPQVDLLTYKDDGPREKMIRRCYKGRSEDYISSNYSTRMRVIDRWREAIHLPARVIYCQNIKDYKHTRTQMEPFWDDLSLLREQDYRFRNVEVEFHMFNRKTPKGGHVPMEKADTIALWSKLLGRGIARDIGKDCVSIEAKTPNELKEGGRVSS
ncbi:MAG: glycosyl transferase family 2 [Cypionkella sp.]|uniref:hypothetical protein n=1 Tax=Cypionkella sp. TaxID=2811411 RepID=UPI0026293F78|nr:hypothetical protein [Cypionkella sp.]MDB5661605.1 glycosyl transferase family 2 [Cypionkella sp.]